MSTFRSLILQQQNWPALVIYESEHDIVLAFISSKVPACLSVSDVPLTKQQEGFQASGLNVDSTIRLDKITTVVRELWYRVWGIRCWT